MVKRFLFLALLLLPALAKADFVRNDTGPGWLGGADGTLDLTNSGDPVVVLFSARRVQGFGGVFQGQVPAIDTTAPEVMNQAIATSRDGSGQLHTESWVRTTAKTGSTPIDTTVTGYDNQWTHYAMLLEGFSPTVSDSCSVGVAGYTNVTSVSCSVTVPANGIVVVFVHNNTNLSVTSWLQGATERLGVTTYASNSFITAATKVETSGVTQAYGANFAASESGILQVLVFDPAAVGASTFWSDNFVEPDGSESMDGIVSGGALASPATDCEITSSGDQVPVTSGGSTVAGICAVSRTMFQSGGALVNTRINGLDSAFLRNATEITTPDDMTLTPSTNFGQISCDPYAVLPAGCNEDSIFRDLPPGYVIGDDYWAYVSSGACNIPGTGVPECTVLPATIELRAYDVSLGSWGTEETIFEPELPGENPCDVPTVKSPLNRTVKQTVTQVVCP